MEQGPASLKPDYYTETSCEFDDLEQPLELTSELQDEFIKINALDIAVKFYDSVDGLTPIETEHYQSLYESGWAAQPAEEVIRIFGDWQTFQQTVAEKRSELTWSRWRDRQRLLAEADQALEAGAVPANLFKKVEPFVSPEQPVQRTRKNGSIYIANDSGTISHEDVSPEEKLTRYCRFKLAKEILSSAGKPPSEARLLSLALGMYLKDVDDDSGRLAGSFNSEITKASGNVVSQGTVEVKADSMGIFEYVYPDIRKKMLADIQRDSKYQAAGPKQTSEILYDIATGNTLIGLGWAALDGYLEQTQSYEADIIPINEALTRKDIDVRFSDSVVAYHYRDYTKGGYAAYGKWLKSLIGDAEVTARLLRRANHLGLGPSPEQIANRFDRSLSGFYDNADLTKRNIKNQFEDWDYDDFINHLRRVHEETGERLSIGMLKDRIKEGKDEPSPDLMRHKFGSRNKMFAEAGSRPINQPISREDCFVIGIEFFEENGRLIEPSDIENDSDLPSRFPFHKHFDGFKGYKKELAEKLEQLGYEVDDTQELAA